MIHCHGRLRVNDPWNGNAKLDESTEFHLIFFYLKKLKAAERGVCGTHSSTTKNDGSKHWPIFESESIRRCPHFANALEAQSTLSVFESDSNSSSKTTTEDATYKLIYDITAYQVSLIEFLVRMMRKLPRKTCTSPTGMYTSPGPHTLRVVNITWKTKDKIYSLN